MIKILEEVDSSRLEKAVNEYIDTCGSKIESIQFTCALNEDGIILHCCIVHDLSFVNQYK